ncbi:spermidine synthase-like protein [Streptomyces abyssalis]|uniref:Spermidine synthase-like protein n=1 Tax=Streptomyces abyssalis TaxID=933944 RepID=A0A1E7JVE2_9ACTN|nr:fused MFS/spermidine synthase [Streptomyces abyssalis]OEU94456.1 spermidine synthase-like protein [Streptomyces abyssalis]OEU95837.1 spermidine synthase-like protein [Streptomyces abyssalis]OEV06951.1 spermidine synthase-like protein [Streptomyces nanshensis]
MNEEPIPVTRAVEGGTAKLLPDIDQEGGWLLTVDGAPQSYVDLGDATHLEFEYARRVAHVLDLAAEPGKALDVLHLGGGALTLPRYVAATRPGSRQRVADTDAALLGFVQEHLPLPPGADIALAAEDARDFLDASPAASADVVIADVYDGVHVPPHLTTVSCAQAAGHVLRESGVCVLNVADAAPFRFAASQVATFRTVFEHICVVAEPSVLRGRRFGNIVVAASHEPFPADALARRTASDAFPARVVHGAALDRLTEGAVPVGDGEAAPSPEPPEGAFTIG